MGIDSELFVRVRCIITDAEIRHLASDCAEAFGHNHFWIRRQQDWHAIERLKEDYHWDSGDDLIADGSILQVNLWIRYWGVGYERGDLPFLIVLAEWLERRLPGCELIYGGDSSGCGPERFDQPARAKRLDHFAKVGNSPYRESFSRTFGDSAPVCLFCQNRHYTIHTWGPGNTRIATCHGCGEKITTTDNWKNWEKVLDARH